MEAARLRMMTKSLPVEVLMEILTRLPIKLQMRFRCVSKTWLRFLTIDPHFIKLHQIKANNNNNIENPSILAVRELDVEKPRVCYAEEYTACDEAIVFDFPFNNSSSSKTNYQVCGICNGLLCLTYQYSQVYVWNPLTGDHITFPCSPIPLSQIPSGAKNVVFGFGFHQGTNQYKVIRLVSTPSVQYSASEFQSHVSVYALGTDSWRTLADIPYRVSLVTSSSALVNGALHWFAVRPGSLSWNVILSFDVKGEFFQEIPQPNGGSYCYPNSVSVGELGGLLSIFCALVEEDVQIWVMKEYGVVGSWTKQFKIGRPEIPGSFTWLEPLGVTSDGEIIIKKDSWELILYDLKTNSIRNFNKFGFPLFCGAYTYKGSLVSPKLLTNSGASRR